MGDLFTFPPENKVCGFFSNGRIQNATSFQVVHFSVRDERSQDPYPS